MKRGMGNKSAQLTVFVIIAIVLVAGIAGFFIVKGNFFNNMPTDIAPVYDYYMSCIDKVVSDGANTMASQAGWLSSDFEPGSVYAPFSSHLSFMGLGVPYWYYISGNGIEKENIPSLKNMNEQLAEYVKQEVTKKCDFSSFVAQGYELEFGDISSVKATIQDNKIGVSLAQKILIKKGGESYSIGSHKVETGSNLGRFYGEAKKIYDYEQKSLFLENYSRDVIYTYAPVSGVVLNCSPVVWSPYKIFDDVKAALAANLGNLKLKGDYYSLSKQSENYFVVDAGINLGTERVRFLYSPNWSSRFEVWPTKNSLMVANPIGNQQGLAMLGFCYAPYKFVYDAYFPVLVQIYDEDAKEVFQFPLAVVINKNNPRVPVEADYTQEPVDICENSNVDINVNTYNNNLEPVEANLQFKCLTSMCDLGKTKIDNSTGDAFLSAKVPACINGVLIANSEGYKEKKYIMSTNEETSADIILERQYNLPVKIYVDGSLSSDNAVLAINEIKDNSSEFIDSLSYPLNQELKLGEGDYEFDLKVYKSGNVVIPSTTTKQCVTQPRAGIIGLVAGLEEQKCFDVNIPSQTLSNLVYAGGKLEQYISESELKGAKEFRIYVTSVKLPSNLEEIQSSYDQVDSSKLTIDLA